MANTIKVLLWLRRTKTNKEGLAPLMLRLSFKNNQIDKASGYYVNPNDWNASKQRLKGNKNAAIQINEWINETLVKISDIFKEEHKKNQSIHLPFIMDRLFAKTNQELSLLNLILEHNQQLKARVNKGCAYSTYEKYVFTYNKVKAFIESHLKKKDILLRELNTQFIMDFDHYLRTNDNNQHNTVVKYCINLKRIINVAVLKGLLIINPLNAHQIVYKDTPQVYLDEMEVIAIEQLDLIIPRLLLVRDLFLFQCSLIIFYCFLYWLFFFSSLFELLFNTIIYIFLYF